MKTDRTTFEPAIMSNHISVVGKTGSGKTITTKAIVEQAFAEGANVCVLDPIKSDWWGLTLSADGKRPGLPFHILGGPVGHVPLHGGAGAAIGQLVASGALRHSILDMAHFGPGELNGFYVAFAEALFRNKTRKTGVLYLVMEEAHVFCPKEREGVRDENMAVFWTKRLATAARSNGVRILAATQRTQALHNSVLSSSGTIIAHRMTFPADRKPIIDWMKAGMDAATAKQVEPTLASLKTGEAWVCCTESTPPIAERRTIPMIGTFDNSSTPTGADESGARPPAIDQAALRSIVGEAVKEAEANDPKKLKERVAELERDLEDARAGAGRVTADGEEANRLRHELDEATQQLETLRGQVEDLNNDRNALAQRLIDLPAKMRDHVDYLHASLVGLVQPAASALASGVAGGFPPIPPRRDTGHLQSSLNAKPLQSRELRGTTPATTGNPVSTSNGKLPDIQQRFLDAAASLTALRSEVTRETVCGWLGRHPRGGSVGEILAALEAAGMITSDRGRITVTPAGMAQAGRVSAREAIERAKASLSGAQRNIFDILVKAYPGTLTREAVAEMLNIHPRGGSFGENIGALKGRGLIESDRGVMKARAFLFGR